MPNDRVTGFAQLAVTNLVSKGCWALTLLLLIKTLGTESFGVLATLWSMAVITASFADLGTGQALLREASRDPMCARGTSGTVLQIQLLATAVLGVTVISLVWNFFPLTGVNTHSRSWVIILSILAPLIDRFQSLFTVWSQLSGNYKTFARLRSSYFILLLGTLGTAAWQEQSLLVVCALYFLLTLIFAVLMGLATWRLLPGKGNKLSTPTQIQMMMRGFPFLGIMILAMTYGRIEVSILGGWGLLAAAGAFHFIYQFVLIFYSAGGMLFTIVYPRLYKHRRDQKSMLADYRDIAQWLSLLSWIAVPLMVIFAKPLLYLLGASDLAAFAPMMRVLACIVALLPISAALDFLLPMDMMKTRILSDLVGLGVTLMATVLAAMRAEPLLAAWGALGGYACSVVIAHIALQRVLPGITRTVSVEFAKVGARVLPLAIFTTLLPGAWSLRCAFFVLASGTVLWMTKHSARARTLLWLGRKG